MGIKWDEILPLPRCCLSCYGNMQNYAQFTCLRYTHDGFKDTLKEKKSCFRGEFINIIYLIQITSEDFPIFYEIGRSRHFQLPAKTGFFSFKILYALKRFNFFTPRKQSSWEKAKERERERARSPTKSRLGRSFASSGSVSTEENWPRARS